MSPMVDPIDGCDSCVDGATIIHTQELKMDTALFNPKVISAVKTILYVLIGPGAKKLSDAKVQDTIRTLGIPKCDSQSYNIKILRHVLRQISDHRAVDKTHIAAVGADAICGMLAMWAEEGGVTLPIQYPSTSDTWAAVSEMFLAAIVSQLGPAAARDVLRRVFFDVTDTAMKE